MWEMKDLIEHMNSTRAQIHGQWVPARPTPLHGLEGFRRRLRDAWAVLTGKVDAFTWPEGQ